MKAKGSLNQSRDLKKGNLRSKGTNNSFPSLDVSAIEEKTLEDTISFEIPDLDPIAQKEFQKTKDELVQLIQNEHLQDPKVVLFKDPIYDELKKEEKPKPPAKNQPPVEEKPIDIESTKDSSLFDGNRLKTEIPIYQNSLDQRNVVLESVAAPVYGDPMKEPIPGPRFEEIITKQSHRHFDSKVSKEFSILTPKDAIKEFKVKTLLNKKDSKRPDKKEEPKEEKTLDGRSSYRLEDLIQNQTRWVIPPNSSLTLVVRFFTKVTGSFESNLTFDNTFGLKRFSFHVSAKSDFPQLINNPKNFFTTIKKSRSPTLPESLLYKSYVQSENLFDFGPLLVGKNPTNKQDKVMMSINSTLLKMTNQGPFPCQLEFALRSSIADSNPEYKKDIFQLSHDRVTLTDIQQGQDIRVWAFPDAAQKFRDELIVMIKDNPLPIIIPLQCTGCKPSIDIIEGSSVKFSRILLRQTAKKEIRLRNNGSIPIRYRLKETENLPEEFSISQKEGELKPTEEAVIEVTFKGIRQQKFSSKLILVADDLEEGNTKSEPKEIPIEAEAFDISVDLKFSDNNTENLLDFGSMRVGDFKDQSFIVKNVGLYNVKFCFVIKKKLFKESFRIEPNEVELAPNDSKEILVRCSTNRELKLKTNNNTTDLMMEVLEGKTLEITKVVPLNVSVNAVFSKYSVVPLKSINFGPIQFNENKTRTFEIKNEGLFEFSFSLFDFTNEEFRRELDLEKERDRQNKLEAASTLVPTDPKKGPKKEAKEVKKDIPKKGKGGKG